MLCCVAPRVGFRDSQSTLCCVAPRVGVRDSQSTLCCVATRVGVRDSQSTLCRAAPRVGVRDSQSTLWCVAPRVGVRDSQSTLCCVLSNPLLASSPSKEVTKKEVQSSDSEVELFAPPPTAPVPQKKVKGKTALPSAPPIDPPASKRRTGSTIPRETTSLGVGDWLTDKDIVCWLNQEVYHNEIDEPRVWTLALLYIKTLSRYMDRVESGTRLANMRWCRRHIFVVSSDDKEGLH